MSLLCVKKYQTDIKTHTYSRVQPDVLPRAKSVYVTMFSSDIASIIFCLPLCFYLLLFVLSPILGPDLSVLVNPSE